MHRFLLNEKIITTYAKANLEPQLTTAAQCVHIDFVKFCSLTIPTANLATIGGLTNTNATSAASSQWKPTSIRHSQTTKYITIL